jgi:Na+:H+ antiporter, NhaA family
METAGGISPLASTIAAPIWTNSRWEASYHALWDTQVVISVGHFFLSESRHEWINDGLMSIIFFLLGLEIKTKPTAKDQTLKTNRTKWFTGAIP